MAIKATALVTSNRHGYPKERGWESGVTMARGYWYSPLPLGCDTIGLLPAAAWQESPDTATRADGTRAAYVGYELDELGTAL